MRTPGSILARLTLNTLGLDCHKLYTQQRVNDRSYKIYGNYSPSNLGRLQQELAANGARNVRPVYSLVGNYNAGVRFEY